MFSFIDGIRFDLSVILTFFGLPLLLLNLPVGKKWWFKFWSAFLTLGMFWIIILLVSDLIYFREVRRHLSDELLLVFNDFGFILGLIFENYLPLLVMIILFIGIVVWAGFNIIEKKFYNSEVSIRYELIKQFLILCLIFLGIRGTVGRKPINIIDAFGMGSTEYGNLVLNGVFTTYHTSRNTENVLHDFYEKEEAISFTSDFIKEGDETFTDSLFPLTRKRTDFFYDRLGTKRRLNVVVFLLESWSSEFIDCLSDKGFGVTPNFDSLASKGILFHNFYANGQRSIYGITSTFLSIPQIQGIPYLGTGLELSDIFRIGSEIKKYGYKTLFAQTSLRSSYRVDAIARGLGFDEYYGRQDFPLIYPYITDEIPSFGWDYEALIFLEKRLSEMEEPFFAFLFTGTTHRPYLLPDKKFEKCPHDREGLNGFLNVLSYSDWSIGEFFKKASKQKWFDQTIFVFTADHALGRFQGNDLDSRFKIPFMIYAPSFSGHYESDKLGSQVDILPTIIDISGLDVIYSGIGKSLMRDYNKRAVIFLEGNNMGIITERGYLKHSREKRLEYFINNKTDSAAGLDYMEKLLLSTDQTLYSLLKTNRFYNNGVSQEMGY